MPGCNSARLVRLFLSPRVHTRWFRTKPGHHCYRVTHLGPAPVGGVLFFRPSCLRAVLTFIGSTLEEANWVVGLHGVRRARDRRKLKRAVQSALEQTGGNVDETASLLRTMAITDPDLMRAQALEFLEDLARKNPGLEPHEIGRLAMRVLTERAAQRKKQSA
jgi:hypothetical protein